MISSTKTRFHEIRLRLEAHVPSSGFNGFLWEFFLFGFKQGWACLFGGILLSLVLLTKEFWPGHAWLARYDFLFLAALAVQILMLLFRIGHVPLFSGFMYASVGSYLARVNRILDMRYLRYPPRWATLVLTALIYVNFFSHHFIPDLRVGLFVLAGAIFGRTWAITNPTASTVACR